jgi:hypothetical protein
VWTAAEERELAALYPDTPMPELTARFGVPVHSIHSKAHRLGLRRSQAFLDANSGNVRKGERRSPASEFTPGHVPWNKGKKGLDIGGHATRFQKGQRGSKFAPIGSERISKEGYRQRKMTATGYPPKDWRNVHHLVWEATHGPIPAGHVVAFINGDKTDVRLENLELLHRRELMGRNTIHRLPEELQQTIIVKRTLVRKINRVEKERTDEERG